MFERATGWDSLPEEVRKALEKGALWWSGPGRDVIVVAEHKADGVWRVEPRPRVQVINSLRQRGASTMWRDTSRHLAESGPAPWLLALWRDSYVLAKFSMPAWEKSTEGLPKTPEAFPDHASSAPGE